jgi:hypothetical protein
VTHRPGDDTDDDPTISFLLDASAVGAFGHCEHVGEPIVGLGDEPGYACFGVPVLALAAAWRDAEGKDAIDLIVNLTRHPRYLAVPVTEDQTLRATGLPADSGLISPWNAWEHLGSADLTHAIVAAISLRCPLLTAVPDLYAAPGITVTIPADGNGWTDEAGYWPA